MWFSILLAIVPYTVSLVAQTYWQQADISLYGQFIFFLVAVSLLSGVFLLCLGLYVKDLFVLLPATSIAQRRVFCFTCCPCVRAQGDEGIPPPSAFSSFPLRSRASAVVDLLARAISPLR